ncbi:FGGY-family carbohydrate kinase [Emticicia sp. C21]|uniref:FGGY-family carbohydrate kinase n=1 Tax=Emticicia sp. C21 TaxID=2302915 RepID=UPI000E344862|nr:FGGY family carbohydrate kinase [Emticicia sp. C21]RFS13522.1 carbohydrate kinase [Emticicia sp. C21]
MIEKKTSTPVCAVFDIGKTNKKLLVFDQNYHVLKEEQVQLEESLDDDGYPTDDLLQLTNWIKNSFQTLSQNPNFSIKGLNFSAYGASLVHLNGNGKPVAALYNYLKNFPKPLHKEFLEKYSKDIFRETASPDLGMLNSSLQLYWLKKEKPTIFHQIRHSLHLPQYCSFLFTNQAISEITSVGCHTLLWDFEKDDYHSWVEAEHLHSISQKPMLSNNVITDSTKEFPIGIGIHDSSSALVPYLKSFDENFILLSTGTWAISLNPFSEEPLTANQLAKDCLCYLNFEGKPVKASRIFAGNEHERQIKHLADYFNVKVDYFKQVKFDRDLIMFLRSKYKQATPDTADVLLDCPFVERNINLFKSYEEAYHQFMLDLVAQQIASLRLAIGRTNVKKIFVDGGFSKNEIYMNLLADAFFNKQVFASEIAQASALGAALVIHEHWNNQPIPEQIISLKRYF